MSKARDIIDGPAENKWFSWISSSSQTAFSYGIFGAQWSYMNARHIGWWVVTTGMITALPLIFEINREGALEDTERLEVSNRIEAGSTPQELVSEGYASAVEPKVLK
ncbi:hypothetical protein B484DRAFT_425445 [Ochromonadaceae sp. CCMP2298]|nr:hypothetical protein B484DRAFT_425445 [Ochromonadaceae sp. CCMP2298]|eukprot:CAMPEP_0173193084 /NCGR_PEP_ID=MMETSP1141-20130122/13770_1 /TAXON_ID=483371 /ORGANISM="non described non described, Strain CCMP2298" /LENGTH=106 /DNA_ID=CAMNT_0014117397 /DNA_START=58 /DNA_END=378 /DNA_ORIENTATION=-